MSVSGVGAGSITRLSVDVRRQDGASPYAVEFVWSDPASPHEVDLSTQPGRYDVLAWTPGYAPGRFAVVVSDAVGWTSVPVPFTPAIGDEPVPLTEPLPCEGVLEGTVAVSGRPGQTGTSVRVTGPSLYRIAPVVGGRFQMSLPAGAYTVTWEGNAPRSIVVPADGTLRLPLEY